MKQYTQQPVISTTVPLVRVVRPSSSHNLKRNEILHDPSLQTMAAPLVHNHNRITQLSKNEQPPKLVYIPIRQLQPTATTLGTTGFSSSGATPATTASSSSTTGFQNAFNVPPSSIKQDHHHHHHRFPLISNNNPSSLNAQPEFGIDSGKAGLNIITTLNPYILTHETTPSLISPAMLQGTVSPVMVSHLKKQPYRPVNSLNEELFQLKHENDLNNINSDSKPQVVPIELHHEHQSENDKMLHKDHNNKSEMSANAERTQDMNQVIQVKEREIAILEQKLRTEERLRQKLGETLSSVNSSSKNPSHEEEMGRLRRLLSKRDNQLKQAEFVADTRQQQYQNLLKELAVKEDIVNRFKQLHPEDPTLQNVENKTAIQLDYLESEVTSMRRVIDELLFDKQELQQLLIQKDKQIAVFTGLDSSMPEASAVQLSVQAISMVQSATELKEQIRSLELELEANDNKVLEYKARFETAFNELAEKRQESAALVETLATRDMKLARLDTLLQYKDKEIMQLKDESRVSICKERENVARLETELKIIEDTHKKLREELSLRDDNALNLKSEIVRQSRYNHSAEEQIKVLGGELVEAQKHLQRLIKQNVAKDRCMLELGQRLKENETRRQISYLADLAKGRQLYSDNLNLKNDGNSRKFNENKNDHNNSPIIVTQVQSDLYNNIRSNRINSSKIPERRMSNVVLSTVERNDRKTSHSTETKKMYRAASQHRKSRCRSAVEFQDDTLMTLFGTNSTKLNNSAPPDFVDPIEAALQNALLKPEWRALKPLFFQISSGLYLFGAQRVRLRYTLDKGLEGQPDLQTDTWLPFDTFIAQLVAGSSTINQA